MGSLAMDTCASVMKDFTDPLGQHDACVKEGNTCKWIPCSQVGVCIEASMGEEDENKNELLVTDAGKRDQRKSARTPKPAKEPKVRPTKAPREKRVRPTKAPRIKPTRAPVAPPTPPVNE